MTCVIPSVRIGVDVGGTNTDAVVLCTSKASGPNRGVIAHFKTATTSPDVTDGIEAAVRAVLDQSEIRTENVACITIGTTHFLNAVVEHDARRLSKVAIIRLSTSYTSEIPPFSDFPPALKEIMNGYYGYVNGGLHIDGSQESPIIEAQVVRECNEIKARNLNTVVIVGVFSPIDNHFKQEEKVRNLVLREIPHADVVCSSQVANLGLLERENAAILNASILKFARRTIKGFRGAMKRLDLDCPMFLTQNDGTLIDSHSAAKLPIKTFSSGATNSMRGAAYLGLSPGINNKFSTSSIVIDIGGTTSDVGVLLPSGYPRQVSAFSSVAGIRINFGMPHVESIGLGGGSLIAVDEDGKVTVGPSSVGYLLTKDSKVFGGDVLTATDIAVAHNPEIKIGNSLLVKGVELDTITSARDRMKVMLEKVIDSMKTSPDPLPVLLVGGGSTIAPNDLEGVSMIIRPPFFEVANAVGAAISKVGSTVDIIQSTSDQTVAEALEHARLLAVERAVEAGAIRNSITLTELESIPLQYVENRIRTIARVAGDYSLDLAAHNSERGLATEEIDQEETPEIITEKNRNILEKNLPPLDITSYRPKIVQNETAGRMEWIVSETDLVWLADGCYVLGCAGGGTPMPEFIKLRDQVRNGHIIRIIDSASLAPDAVIYWGGNMGSPAVSAERLSASEVIEAIHEMMYYARHDSFDAVMGAEIGGANGLQPLLWGSTKNFDRPIVDADWMGRAYPNYWQNTLVAHEANLIVPCAISSGSGKCMIMTKTDEDMDVDRVIRAPCIEMGSYVGMVGKPTTAKKIHDYAVTNTLSQAWRIGRCIALAKKTNTLQTLDHQLIKELGGPSSAKLLFRGKIIAVERKLIKGHSYGEIIIEQLTRADEEFPTSNPVKVGGILKIPFKNENIFALHVDEDGKQEYVAMVPDLIAVLDSQTGKALGVPEFRYGIIVTVIGIPCSNKWVDSPRGLEIGGPGAFDLDFPYKPLGTYVKPRSVIEEFS